MREKRKDVRRYLEELERNKEGRPDQVSEGIEIYIDLWKKAISKGIISPTDGIDVALAKLEVIGGLYKAAEEERPT
jgi:hypothetical protein